MAAVKVQFEVGHTSKLRNKKTPEGFTHDWEIYVQGISKSDISSFVDKVVFNLHDSFPKPKRVCKEPPYAIQESGYAGFLMPIDIYFRNRDEPKRFQFTYDLDLQQTGPPHHRFEIKKFIFECPSEEFRLKLVKAGGIPVSGVLSGNTGAAHSAVQVVNSDENTTLMYYDLNIKKHKPRIDDKANTFSNLFGTPISKNTSTRCSPERKSSNLSSSHTTTNVTIAESNLDCANNTGILTKEKLSKEREKVIGNMEKEKKDKSEKREKHKQASPYKDSKIEKKSTVNNGSKYEKRIEEKSKKDKLRDKEKERNRERLGSSNLKRANSSQNLREVDVKSPKRQSPLLMQIQSARSLSIGVDNIENVKISKSKLDDEVKAKDGKLKIQNSSSSGKKSKREKKDKDKEKDREKEKREEHREKHRINDSKSRNDHIENNTVVGSVNLVGGSKEIKPTPNSNRGTKKVEKDAKLDIFKTKNFEKPSEKEIIQEKKNVSNNSNIVEKEKKSHKHKKKEKSKDKEREKIKDRLKEKQKLDEIISKKSHEASITKSLKNKQTETKSSQRTSVTTIIEQPNINPSILNTENNVNSTTSLPNMKKSHNREKKSKDKTILDKNLKRNILESDNKKNKSLTNTSSSAIFTSKPVKVAINENLDVSHKNQQKTSTDAQQLSILKSFSANTVAHQTSENSSSSSSDLFDNKKTTNQTDIATSTKKEKKSMVTKTKDLKLRLNEKNTKTDSYNKVEKQDKIQEKDEKKRQRSSTTSNFIEPPVKQFKKEQIVKTIEKSKSPNFRDVTERTGSRETKASLGLGVASTTISDPLLTSTIAANSVLSSMTGTIATGNSLHFKPSISGFLLKSASPTHCVDDPKITMASTNTVFPNEYLCELQQLHQKIMTLQGNEELQHVVEMIAATGCYEITAKTFDFDLCKLDRSTVQRLQEFLSSSVS